MNLLRFIQVLSRASVYLPGERQAYPNPFELPTDSRDADSEEYLDEDDEEDLDEAEEDEDEEDEGEEDDD